MNNIQLEKTVQDSPSSLGHEMHNPFAPSDSNPINDFSAEELDQKDQKPEQPFDIELAAAAIKLKKSIRLPNVSALFSESYSLIAFQALSLIHI